MQTDRYRLASSAIDDVKSWLGVGGVSRVQYHLDREMKNCRMKEDHQREIRDFFGQLVQENQRPLMQLMADGIIPWDKANFLVTCGISESEFDEMLEHVLTGANPFKTRMLANGYSQEVIDQIYKIIDSWLAK